MRKRIGLIVLCLVSIPFPRIARSADIPHSRPSFGLVTSDGSVVRTHPAPSAHPVATLVQETQVRVLGKKSNWFHVLIWGSIHGWMAKRAITFRKPWSSVSTYKAPIIRYQVRAQAAEPVHATALVRAGERLYRSPERAITGWLPAGSTVQVTAWRQDASGTIWYRAGNGWANGAQVQFSKMIVRAGNNGRPLWASIRGKGMWMTLGALDASSGAVLADAAARNGVTHIYVESAISPLGFHGRGSVGSLIDAAHRRHIAVIAWVYPYLYDIASDVALTRRVAAFRTQSGQRFDGIAADLERNMHVGPIQTYSQLVRAYLGARYLLVGVTYPPQSLATYPFATVARSYNVIAPMDYWHQTSTGAGLNYDHLRYGWSYGYRYARESISTIRDSVGATPIEPIGQVFDDFGRLEMGPHAPSSAEVNGFLQGCKAGGAVGVSFFQWMTASATEWAAIHAYHY
ncbi:MAG: SH3 domain-containing protein [Chloroflexota bacterium]